MDDSEAIALLENKLGEYRTRHYTVLEASIGTEDTGEIRGRSGTRYQFQVEAVWDAKPHGNIRVMGAIDDGSWRAVKPLCSDFIMAPDGSFVGEP